MGRRKLPPLYLITDRTQTAGRPLLPLIEQAIRAGVRSIQIREKDLDTRSLLTLSNEIVRQARDYDVQVLVNDRVDVAMSAEATGVHLRAESLPVSVVRRLVGSPFLIGVSAHSIEDVRRAEADGADFAVLGPIYDTLSKRAYGPPLGVDLLEEATRCCALPIYAIGGVTASRVPAIKRAGAIGVAVISAILTAVNVEDATRELIDAWGENPG